MDNIPAEIVQNSNAIQIPFSWFLTSFGALIGTVGALAKVIHKSLSDQIKNQIELIKSQGAQIKDQKTMISKLTEEVNKLRRGCGITSCLFNKNHNCGQ